MSRAALALLACAVFVAPALGQRDTTPPPANPPAPPPPSVSTPTWVGDVPTLVFGLRAADATTPQIKGPISTAKKMNHDGVIGKFWLDNTHGQARIVATYHPTILVSAKPLATFSCGNWTEPMAQLRAQGVVLEQYKLLVMIHTGGNPCSRASGWQMGQWGVIRTAAALDSQIAHEVGHATFNLPHVSSLKCGMYLPLKCVQDEYGHWGDIMGKGDRFGSSNVVHKLNAGIVSPSRVVDHTAAVGVPVDYVVKPAASPDGLLGVRLGGVAPLGQQATSDPAWWVEYRQPVGVDATAHAGMLDLMRGAHILRVGRPDTISTYGCSPCLFLARPGATNPWTASLLPGQVWQRFGWRIETIAATPEALTVRVTKQ